MGNVRDDPAGPTSMQASPDSPALPARLPPPFAESLLDNRLVAFIAIDEHHRIRFFNPGAERIFGIEATAILGEPLNRLIPERFRAVHREHVERFARGPDGTALEYMRPRIRGRRHDGTEFPAEATIAKYQTEEGPRLLAVVRDLLDEIVLPGWEEPGVMRGLQALHANSRVFVHASSGRDLLERACRDLVRIPGYALAWADYAGTGADDGVRPLAASDPEAARFLETAPRAGEDADEGPALIREVLRTGEPRVETDLVAAEGFRPWGPVAGRRGYRTGLVLPLRRGQHVFGVIGILAGIDEAFGEEETGLLLQMADRITSGLMMLRTREAGVEEPELVDCLATILTRTSDLIGFLDPQGNYFYLNPGGRRLTGAGQADRERPLAASAIHPEWAARILRDRAIPEALERGQWEGDSALLDAGGGEVPVSQMLFPHWTPRGAVDCLVTITRAGAADMRDAAAASSEQERVAQLVAAAEEGLRLLGRRQPAVAELAHATVKIPVFHKDRILLLDPARVAWMQADRHYTRVITPDGSYLGSLGLSDLEARLDPCEFLRVHRSHIVNLRFVSEIERRDDRGYLVLDIEDRPSVPVSRRRMEFVRNAFGLA